MNDIKQQMTALVDKWQGKPDPEFMSKEFIEKRFDRIKYTRLRKQLNTLTASEGIIDTALGLFPGAELDQRK